MTSEAEAPEDDYERQLRARYEDIDLIKIGRDLLMAMIPPAWTKQALCRDVPEAKHLNTMYPDRAETPGGKHLVPARKLCLQCPVRYECLEAGLQEEFGIWGGHSLSQRRRIITLVKSGSSLIEASQAIDARSRDARK
jgi:hypothetical protein